MGSRIGLDIFNMGAKPTKPPTTETENDGINQNVNQVKAEIKNTIEVNHDKIEIYLIIIIILLAILAIYFLYLEINKRSKKKYTAPRPAI